MHRVRIELRCPSCGMTARQDALDLLRKAGMLKRAGDDVDEQMVLALVQVAGPKLECSQCGHYGLDSEPVEDQDDFSWPEPGATAKTCRGCGATIPVERLRLLPHNEYCAACQQQRESGLADEGEREFCPWCGQVLTQKTTRRRGVTEYVPACPACGYVG